MLAISNCRLNFLNGVLLTALFLFVIILHVVPASAAAPGAPAIVSSWYGRAGATVSFTPPASNGGKTITGYTVTSSPVGGTDANAGLTGLSHVVTGLTNGTVYTFTVTATNDDGTSIPSAASAPTTARPYSPASGTIDNLVVFARFSGQPEFSQPLSYYNNIFNAPPNSLKSFYLENSYNALTVSTTFYPVSAGSSVVSYQDDHPVSYYKPYNATTNVDGYQSGTEQTAREAAFVTNALTAISSQISAGINPDGDGDGYIDHITFEIYSTDLDPIPVMFSSKATFDTSDSIVIKGKKVGSYTYVVAPQDSVYPDSSFASVEIHEMGHNLGFPDLRNNFNGFNPVGNWDYMGNAYSVVHSGAYMKNRITGWIPSVPEIIPGAATYGQYTINDITQATQNSYKIKLPNTNEFLVLEYRPATGTFESHLPGKGLCITRVNEAPGIWGNMNGDPTHNPIIPFFLYYFRPGGTLLNDGSAANLFTCLDAAAGQTQFNDFSNPACFLSDGSPCGISINNIVATSASSASFFISDPTLAVTRKISGIIKFANNSRVSGATVTLSGDAAGVTTTDSLGQFSFMVNAGGSYTVTPVMSNIAISPVSTTITNITIDQTVNFTATKITRTISGTVTSSGAPLSDVPVNIYSTSGISCSYYIGNVATTNMNGIYSFTVDAGSSCDIIPSLVNNNFAPTGYTTFANITSDQVQDFATKVTTLVSSVNPVNPGQPVTFTATVTGYAPTGTVSFSDNGSALCLAAALPVSKKVTCTTGLLAAGSHSIVAVYSGDANNIGNNSPPLTQIVRTTSTTALGSSANPGYSGQNISFTASVTGNTPSGTLSFSADGTDLCGAVSLVNGQASCSIRSLAMGCHSVVAVYSGDSNNTGSSSVSLTQSVKLPLPTIQATPDATGTVGSPYVFWIITTNATGVTVSGSIPPGFSVVATSDPNVWATNWTPASVGVYGNIILAAQNSDWQASLPPFSVTVKLPAPTIDGHPLTVGMAGVPYSTFTPTPCDQNNPMNSTCNAASFTISGTVPPGLNFNSVTGVLNGTPTSAGTYGNLIISAFNNDNAGPTALPAFTIEISPRIDSFSITNVMSTPRQFHTATTLPNGKVLVTGGVDANFYTPLSSAELYDPAGNSWSSAGSLSVARTYHAATLLKDGRVLVTGGYGSAGLLNSAEIYNPSDNSWTAVAPMTFGHSSHTATLLADSSGTVLVAGGFDPDPDYATYITTVERYIPASDSWETVSQMPEARNGNTATLLSNGKVLFAGGGYIDSAALYDPQADIWSTTSSMINNRSNHTATSLLNGTILVTGGYTLSGESGSAEVYDPVANTWRAVGSMATVRQSHVASLLNDGTVLITGGAWRNSSLSNAYHDFAELYDPATEEWKIAGLMAIPRAYHTASQLPNGDILVAGGSNNDSVLASAELFHYIISVSFASNGGSTVPSQNITFNKTAAAPAPPSRTGYTFAGWYSDSDLSIPFVFTSPITSDTILYAKWAINTYPVTFQSGGNGSLTGSTSQTVAYGSSATQITAVPQGGYHFVNWTGTGGFVATTSNPLTLANVTMAQTITANFAPDQVNGVCGSSNGSTIIAIPIANLCSNGAATAITGSGPWSWSCNGSNGGTTANCAANIQTYSVTPSTGANFTIVPAIVQTVTSNAATSFTVTPASGYGVVVAGCGGSLSGTIYTTGAVAANCTITVTAIARTAGGSAGQPPTINDALKILQAVAGLVTLTPAEQIRYDVAPLGASGTPVGNGVIDVADVILVLRRIIGIGSW